MSRDFCFYKGPRVEIHPRPLPYAGAYMNVYCLKAPGHAGPHLCFGALSFKIEFAPDGACQLWIADRTRCWLVDPDGKPLSPGTLRLFENGPVVLLGEGAGPCDL